MLKTKQHDEFDKTFKSEPPDMELVSETQVLIKYERDSLICNLCLKEFSNEQGYIQHISNHTQTDEGDAECDQLQEAALNSTLNQILFTTVIKQEDQQLKDDYYPSTVVDPFVTSKSMDFERFIRELQVKDEVIKKDQEFKTDSGELDWKLFANCIVKLFDILKMPVNYVPIDNKSMIKARKAINSCKDQNIATVCKYIRFIYQGPRRSRSPADSFICDICKKTFSSRGSLVCHLRIHIKVKTFVCDYCQFVTRNKNTLKDHVMRHTGEKPFQCKFCKYRTHRKCLLTIHMSRHTGDKPYACKLCAYKCVEHSTLLKHMKIHAGDKQCVCSICEYKCYKSGDLVRHMRVHTGEKPYTCETCGRKFSRKTHLKDHIKTHTGIRPFSCQLCNYRSVQSSSLLIHMRNHTGEMPFTCKICNKKFKVKSTLDGHMRTHTGEKPFSCLICELRFSHKASLRAHLKIHECENPVQILMPGILNTEVQCDF